MAKKTNLLGVILAVGLFQFGCGSTKTANNTAASPANTNSAPKADDKPKTEGKKDKQKSALKSAPKPDGSSKGAKKDNPVPEDWIYVYDEARGYGFSVPDGSAGDSDSSGGVDFMGITTPKPSEIDIYVLAFKDKNLTKDNLLEEAVAFLEELGYKVTPGKLAGEGDDYALADATTEVDGHKGRLKILVGTDVTDNYIMILGTDTDRFAANEKIIDEIWGSFEIWSGGASNN